MSKHFLHLTCPNCAGEMRVMAELDNKAYEPMASSLFAQAAQPIGELHRLFACLPSLSQPLEQVDCSVEENISAKLASDFWQLYTVNRWWQEEMMLSVIGAEHSGSGKCKTRRADKPLQVNSCPVQFVELLALFLRNAPQGLVDNVDLSRFRTLFAPLLLAIQTYLEEIKHNAELAHSVIDQILAEPMSIEEKEDNGKK